MSAYIVCMSGSGLPIFSRKKGNTENLPFASTASLNGIRMFGKPFDIEILDTMTDDYLVAWKEFEENVTMIGIASSCCLDVLNDLLVIVFNTVVLIVGIEEIKNQRNLDRIKRELRVCYPVIDRLLDSLDCGDAGNKHSSDIIGYVETILCSENHLLQIVLDSFTECVDSMYSCLLISGKIAVATESWWSLHPDEIRLLTLFAISETTTLPKDIPVFLPYKSPTVAFRFIACTLIPEVQLCCLCGSTPALNNIKHSATQCFKNSTDILNAAVQCSPRNFPAGWCIDNSILGLLLINIPKRKYMFSKCPQQGSSRKTSSGSHRLDIFRSFFYRTVKPFFIDDKEQQSSSEEHCSNSKEAYSNNINTALETYWCSEYHKCYAAKFNDNILCVLFSSSVPTFAMKLITQKCYKNVADKQICW